MSLKRQQHNSLPEVTEDLKNLDEGKQDKIVFASRAPNFNDKGFFWVNQSESGTTMALYVRHPQSGTWRKATLS